MRVCLESGCPTLTDRARCPDHARAKDKARGSSTARGYDSAHRTERARIQRLINKGDDIRCVTCDASLMQSAWDLGHNAARTGYIGPQCITCNRGHHDHR